MLKNMLELNDICEDYGVKLNINKTKTMVIGRKPKTIDIRIKAESVEREDSLKYSFSSPVFGDVLLVR